MAKCWRLLIFRLEEFGSGCEVPATDENTGEWASVPVKLTECARFECLCCGTESYIKYKFCPNCGSKMTNSE